MSWMALELENITNCFLPQLVDQVFEVYRNQAETNSLTKGEFKRSLNFQ